LRTVADARYFGHLAFAARGAGLRSFAAKKFQTVENDRERIVLLQVSASFNGTMTQLSHESETGAEMDPLGNDEIARLLRLKRYEQPPPASFDNFLHEFRRRQRDQLRHLPLWSICVDRARDFVFRHNVRPLACYAAGIAAAAACVAVISITLYQQPDTTQLAVRGSPVPARPPITDRELDFAPREFTPAFGTQSAVLPVNSRDIPVLPADPLRSDEFIPLRLEWESLDDQPLLEK
jgi:hypothetical protein